MKIIYDYLRNHVLRRLRRTPFQGIYKKMLDEIEENRVTNLHKQVK